MWHVTEHKYLYWVWVFKAVNCLYEFTSCWWMFGTILWTFKVLFLPFTTFTIHHPYCIRKDSILHFSFICQISYLSQNENNMQSIFNNRISVLKYVNYTWLCKTQITWYQQNLQDLSEEYETIVHKVILEKCWVMRNISSGKHSRDFNIYFKSHCHLQHTLLMFGGCINVK
jgi:hypothetical protein